MKMNNTTRGLVKSPFCFYKNLITFLNLLLTISNVCVIIYRVEYAPLAQLDRVTGYEPVGQGFESLAACQKKERKSVPFFVVKERNLNGIRRARVE